LIHAVKNVSLSVYAGEILGVAGVAGNGQRELVEAVTGLRPVTEGRIILNGTDITHTPPRKRIDLGIGSVPGERMTGLIPNMSIADNLILKSYLRPQFNKNQFLDRERIHDHVDQLIRKYSISTPSRETPVKLLSGGNIQRALLARELSDSPPVLIATHPTSGLDVGAIEFIWDLFIKERDTGRAILLISEDLEEIMALSDRIAVLFEGEVVGIVKPQETTPEQIGLLMAGAHRESSGGVQ
jgi:simple sugar transport system ATP-binding protein